MSRLKILSAILLAAASAAMAQPIVNAGGTIDGAAFYVGQPVAPGSMVSIFGSGLAASLQQADTVPWSTQLGQTSVTFNGVAAPLYFVSQGQINAQLPWNTLPAGVASGNANVVVTVNGIPSAPQQVPIGQYSPAIFSIPPGGGYSIAINPDGSLSAPAGAIAGFPSRPTRAGEALILLCNGLGPVDFPVANGQPSSDRLRNTTTPAEVLIGGVNAQVLFSGLSPQFPSINQINVVVPAGVAPGNSVPIQIRIGGRTSPATFLVAITP
jgi:uncharacterized protein (TIGR03437 family)